MKKKMTVRALHVAAVVHAAVFFAPFAATATMCDWTDSNDWTDCCSSNVTIVERSLLSRQEVANQFVEGALALKLRLTYSSVNDGWSTFDCAKFDVAVRIGNTRKTYKHVVPYSSGVADYIKDTIPYLFSPPFRESDIYIESVACKMPKPTDGGFPCPSNVQKEEERERLALEEERERLALEEERERLALEQERLNQEKARKRAEEEHRRARAREQERERQRLAQQQRERERQRLAQQQRERERQRLTQQQRERERQRLAEEQRELEEMSTIMGFIGGLAGGLTELERSGDIGMSVLQGLADGFESAGSVYSGGDYLSGTVSKSCEQAQRRVERKLASQDVSSGYGICSSYRYYLQTLQYVKRELLNGGCSQDSLRDYDRAIAETRNGVAAACN